ncbi:MAG: glutamate--tRNA ligase family protein, partial [Pseudomonadota bacterium]
MRVERFAPSPTGRLHLGHAYSALVGWDAAQAAGGVWRLRIEDLDQGRARAAYETGIFDDLRWLGLSWPKPVVRQSERSAAYGAALARLGDLGVVYRCVCTRRDIAAAADAPQEGGPDGPVYPGLCRGRDIDAEIPAALRINMARAAAMVGPLNYLETDDAGENPALTAVDKTWLIESCGDVVLARKDAPASYHLAVVVDDAAEGV